MYKVNQKSSCRYRKFFKTNVTTTHFFAKKSQYFYTCFLTLTRLTDVKVEIQSQILVQHKKLSRLGYSSKFLKVSDEVNSHHNVYLLMKMPLYV